VCNFIIEPFIEILFNKRPGSDIIFKKGERDMPYKVSVVIEKDGKFCLACFGYATNVTEYGE